VRLNAEGDQGLNIGPVGPVLAKIDLDPDDFDPHGIRCFDSLLD